MIGDGEEIRMEVEGQVWPATWHRDAPDGTPHGAAGVCVTSTGDPVLVSEDDKTWVLPAGRPEADESDWETLRRELTEEACDFAPIVQRALHEAGLV